MAFDIDLGDIVQLRKKHPCGSNEWEVVRVGLDVGLLCQGCGRRIMLSRGDFNKRCRKILRRADDK